MNTIDVYIFHATLGNTVGTCGDTGLRFIYGDDDVFKAKEGGTAYNSPQVISIANAVKEYGAFLAVQPVIGDVCVEGDDPWLLYHCNYTLVVDTAAEFFQIFIFYYIVRCFTAGHLFADVSKFKFAVFCKIKPADFVAMYFCEGFYRFQTAYGQFSFLCVFHSYFFQ